jgi:hypothetical protein
MEIAFHGLPINPSESASTAQSSLYGDRDRRRRSGSGRARTTNHGSAGVHEDPAAELLEELFMEQGTFLNEL